MDNPDLLDNLIHDQVILASASTYDPQKLNESNLKVNVNLSRSKDWFVGTSDNPVYPDVIVWQPESPTASKGKTIIAEAIETRKTIDTSSARWKRLANIGIIFYLVVPKDKETQVIQSLNALGIRDKTRLQTWHWDNTQKKFVFESIT